MLLLYKNKYFSANFVKFYNKEVSSLITSSTERSLSALYASAPQNNSPFSTSPLTAFIKAFEME